MEKIKFHRGRIMHAIKISYGNIALIRLNLNTVNEQVMI
jgi:hypothetical protein